MMKDLLERELSLMIAEEAQEGDWGLTDDKSCKDCSVHAKYFYSSCQDRIVMKLHSNISVKEIRLENVFQESTAFRAEGCCDYLLYTADKIVLCELTCIRPEYLRTGNNGGKRAKAYSQLLGSVKKLKQFNSFGAKVSNLKTREAIFAIRKKLFAVEMQEDSVQGAMRPFIKVSDIERRGKSDMGNGFDFLTVEYPQIYRW